MLISAGADVDWASATGLTPWMLATDMNQSKVASMLVDAGASHGSDTTLWLTGELPGKALAARLVPELLMEGKYTQALGDSLSDHFMGAYKFYRVEVGMSPEQNAALKKKLGQQEGSVLYASSVGGGALMICTTTTASTPPRLLSLHYAVVPSPPTARACTCLPRPCADVHQGARWR